MKRQRKGKIIHQSSTAAYLGNVGMVDTENPDTPMPPFHYSVAKIGLVGLTKYMAGALGPWGINVNAIAPGVTMTEATKKIVPEGIMSSLVMFSALRKPLQPDDLAGTAVYLASDGLRHDDGAGAGGRRRHDHARVGQAARTVISGARR